MEEYTLNDIVRLFDGLAEKIKRVEKRVDQAQQKQKAILERSVLTGGYMHEWTPRNQVLSDATIVEGLRHMSKQVAHLYNKGVK